MYLISCKIPLLVFPVLQSLCPPVRVACSNISLATSSCKSQLCHLYCKTHAAHTYHTMYIQHVLQDYNIYFLVQTRHLRGIVKIDATTDLDVPLCISPNVLEVLCQVLSKRCLAQRICPCSPIQRRIISFDKCLPVQPPRRLPVEKLQDSMLLLNQQLDLFCPIGVLGLGLCTIQSKSLNILSDSSRIPL